MWGGVGSAKWRWAVQSGGGQPTRPLTPAEGENFPSLRFGHGKVIT